MNKAAKLLYIGFFALLLAKTAPAAVLWEADTNRGLSVFPILNLAPGNISVAPDPLGQYGLVYKYFLPDTNSAFGKERCESSGTKNPSGEFLMSYNNEYYIGWRAMWNPMPINPGWVALFQMHGYGVSGQGAPLVLRCINGDGNIYMQNNPNGVNVDFWHTKFQTNVWQNFVVHVFLSTNPAVGYTEIWYNGVLQTNINGTTRWYGPTWDNVDGVWSDSYNKLKWGCYRSGAMDGKGDATAYMSDAKIGTSYADVDPAANTDFTITGSPAVETIRPGVITNFTVTVGSVGGFGGAVSLSQQGAPGGSFAIFSPSTITNSGTASFGLITSGGTPLGVYPISLIGTSGSTAHTNIVTLIVSGFQLDASPSAQALDAGQSTNFTITITTNSAFSGEVDLGIGGLPSGVSAGFSQSAFTQSGTSTLTITTTTNTPGGDYPLTLYGTNGSLTISASVILSVNGAVANPGTLVWTDGSGANTNWSTALNWTNLTAAGNGPPGPANNLQFTNLATTTSATVNNVINGNFKIGSLLYANNAPSSSPNYHVTALVNGAVLTVTNGLAVGTSDDSGADQVVNAAMTGPDGTLILSNGIFSVTQGSGSDGAHQATLDLSGLGTLKALNISKLGVALYQFPPDVGNGGQRSCGVLYLAKTNLIAVTSTGVTNGIVVGWNDSQGNGNVYGVPNPADKTSALYLGQTNAIYTDAIYVGSVKILGALIAFNPDGLNNPMAYIRGISGANSRVSLWGIGDTSMKAGSNQSASGTNDFSGGTVDALVNNLSIGVTQTGAYGGNTGNGSGTLTFDGGTMDVNYLTNGWSQGSGTNGTDIGAGTINVNGTGTLKVNHTLALAMNTGTGGGVPVGTLNLNGGIIETTNIIGGTGVSTIHLNNGTLELDGTGQIAGLSSLSIGSNGVSDSALLADAATVTTAGAIVIAPNGIIAGNTVITSPGLTVNGTIEPGNGVPGGMTNNGPVTFGAGGQYQVILQDALAGPAGGWSFLKANNNLNIQSSSANPFIISVQPPTGTINHFDYNTNYDWMILTAASGISGYAADKFNVDSSAVENDLAGGYFYLHAEGNSLVLSFTNNHPPAASTATLHRTGSALTIPLAALSTHWSDPDDDPVTLAGINTNSANGAGNVSTDGTNIYYLAAGSGFDSLTYTVQDVRTNPPAIYQPDDTVQTATGTVNIVTQLPSLNNPALSGNGLVFSGSGGVTNGIYYVLTSSNITLPMTNWSIIETNAFDAGGNFNFTNMPDPGAPQTFYRLLLP